MSDPMVMARKVLLDVLEGLGGHRDAMVLIGAQAIYLRVGEADLAVAPFTTDGDLAIDVALLADAPALESALAQAGFRRDPPHEVGIWKPITPPPGLAKPPSVDLLVPVAVSPTPDGRTALLAGHDRRVARNVDGIEGALADNDPMLITANDPADRRAVRLRVAGVAALLIAKVHKIRDRSGARTRDKDALDVLRLLRGASLDEAMAGFARARADARATGAVAAGIALLRAQFASVHGIGVGMLRRAVGELADPEEYAASCVALTNDLLAALAA